MISKSDIFRIARKKGFPAGTIEKEYFLTIFLEQIAKHDRNFVFKGGTALSKAYFDYYRLSEDLDFTYIGHEIKNTITVIHEICKNLNLEIKDENKTQDSYTAKIKFVGPLQYPNYIKIDTSMRENLIFEPKTVEVHSLYAEINPFKVKVYDIKEITAEKIRTLIQRKKPRDYFDIWFIFKNKDLDTFGIKKAVIEKCRRIDVKYEPNRIFSDIENLRRQWKTDLIHLVAELPDFDVVMLDLRKKLEFIVT